MAKRKITKKTNDDRQNITQKTNDRATRTPLRPATNGIRTHNVGGDTY